MKQQPILAMLLGTILFPLLCSVTAESALTGNVFLEWSTVVASNTPGETNLIVDIAADGAGSCAVKHCKISGSTTNWYLTRFDKKGAKVWGVAFFGYAAIDILHCDKKAIIYAEVSITGFRRLVLWNAKNDRLDAQPLSDGFMYPKATTLTDRKGFFSSKYDSATKSVVLLRYLNKGESYKQRKQNEAEDNTVSYAAEYDAATKQLSVTHVPRGQGN